MSEEKKEIVFANGFRFSKKPNDADFVVGHLSANVDNAIEFLKTHKNDKGYVNMQIKIAKSGSPYISLDQFVPKELPF